jgi:hypothetical protein
MLGDNERNERRTIMDALEVLRTEAKFEENDVAVLWLGGLRLPSTKIVHLVCISFESQIHKKKFFVSLPSANSFKARFEGEPEPQEFEIASLAGATINGWGHVRLSDGTQILGVEIIPALLPYKVTRLDWAIIRQTVAALGVEDECRYDPGELAQRALGTNPIGNPIDCSRLSGHTAPLLKVIQGRIQDHEPGFKTVSLQKIADTLRKFGMRIPSGRASSRSGRARANN